MIIQAYPIKVLMRHFVEEELLVMAIIRWAFELEARRHRNKRLGIAPERAQELVSLIIDHA
jgi:hypothetical protein